MDKAKMGSSKCPVSQQLEVRMNLGATQSQTKLLRSTMWDLGVIFSTAWEMSKVLFNRILNVDGVLAVRFSGNNLSHIDENLGRK